MSLLPTHDNAHRLQHQMLHFQGASFLNLFFQINIRLHIDIVGSTTMSKTLPVERLATIIQTFTQEMSLIIAAYGGYVLKYVGDSVLAFFPVNLEDKYLPCANAVNCARSMIKIMRARLNPILNEYDYPEMRVRVGIDVGRT